MVTTPFWKLEDAINEVEQARRCIRENTGPDKELARESYESAVAEILVPALTYAIEDIQDPRALESIAKFVHKKMAKEN